MSNPNHTDELGISPLGLNRLLEAVFGEESPSPDRLTDDELIRFVTEPNKDGSLNSLVNRLNCGGSAELYELSRNIHQNLCLSELLVARALDSLYKLPERQKNLSKAMASEVFDALDIEAIEYTDWACAEQTLAAVRMAGVFGLGRGTIMLCPSYEEDSSGQRKKTRGHIVAWFGLPGEDEKYISDFQNVEVLPFSEWKVRLKGEYVESSGVNHAYGSFCGNIAFDLDGMGRVEDAKKVYRHSLEFCPFHVESLNNLAHLLYEQAKSESKGSNPRKATKTLEEAEDLVRRAISIAPKSPSPYGTLGHILRRRGRFDEARKAYSKANDIIPDETKFHSQMSLVLTAEGKTAEAQQYLKKHGIES